MFRPLKTTRPANRVRTLLLGAVACGSLLLSAPVAQAQTVTLSSSGQTAMASAQQLQASGDAQAAYAALDAVKASSLGNPDFDYQLGLAAADTGRHTEAILAFQRVLAVQPDNAQARAELARAYALAGDIDTARAQFDTVVADPSLPDPVRQRLDSLVRDYSRTIDGASSVSGFVDVKAGWDSNINGATDENQIVIPLFAAFGPGTLGAAARSTESGFVEAIGGVSGVKALNRQTRVFGSALASHRENFNESDFNQTALTGTVGVGHTLASRDVVSVSGQLQQFWLGGDGFRRSAGAVAQYTKALSGGRALSVSGEFFDLNFDNDPLRDAERYGVGVSLALRQAIISASIGHEETKSPLTEHLSFDYVRVNAGAEKRLNDRFSLVGGVTGQIRRHDAPDPLFLTEREDEQLDITAGIKVRVLDDATFLRPQVSYTRNWSNFALNDFDRVAVSIGLRREF